MCFILTVFRLLRAVRRGFGERGKIPLRTPFSAGFSGRMSTAGLLTRYRTDAFPSRAGTVAKSVGPRHVTHSSGNCCRIARHSHLILQVLAYLPEPLRDKSTLFSAEVTEFSPALQEALGRLLPQLSERLAGPSEARLRQLLAHPSTALFVAETEDRMVGVLTLGWYDAPSGRKAWIEDVVVDATARGGGIGRALVEEARGLALKIGADRLLLTSNPRRTAARALYRKCGFNEAETSVFVFKMDRE